MKRVFLLCCMAVLATAMYANNQFKLTVVEGHPGEAVWLSLSLDNSDTVTAMEACIPLGYNLKYIEGTCFLSSARSDGHEVTAKMTDNVLKIYVYSLGLKPLKGNGGELLRFQLQLGKEPATYTLAPQTIVSNAAGTALESSVSQPGSVTILSPKLEVITPVLDYGHIPIRSDYSQTLILKNTGNEALTIADIAIADEHFSATETAITLEAGSLRHVPIAYRPTNRGAITAPVTITSNAINGTQRATLKADPFSVNELHATGASGISDSEVTVSVRMNNMEPIVGAQMAFHLPEQLQYVEGSATLSARADGHQATAMVDNDNTLTLLIHSPVNKPLKEEDGDILSFRLRLAGQTGWYEVLPQDAILSNVEMENMTSAVYGDYIEIQSPAIAGEASLDFGLQSISRPQVGHYVLRNSGEVTLTVERITFLAEGYRVSSPLPFSVQAGDSETIVLEYLSEKAESFGTTMNIYSNDPQNRMKTVALSGKSFSPNELAIAGQYEGTNRNYKIDISLDNDAELTAVQFDIQTNMAQPPTSPIITGSDRIAEHSVNIYSMTSGVWRVLIYSMENALINASQGSLAQILFPRQGDSENATFSLSNVVLSTKDGVNLESPIHTAAQAYSFVLPTSLSLDKASLPILLGSKGQLTASIAPGNTTDKTLVWTSADENIATVDEFGTVTAVGIGQTKVVASTWNGINKECIVSVNPVPSVSVSLDKAELSLKEGESEMLKATVLPAHTTYPEISWVSSDENVATVSPDGMVKAVKTGTCTVS